MLVGAETRVRAVGGLFGWAAAYQKKGLQWGRAEAKQSVS